MLQPLYSGRRLAWRGSVRRSDNRLRASARLGVQAEVAGEIGKALDQALTISK